MLKRLPRVCFAGLFALSHCGDAGPTEAPPRGGPAPFGPEATLTVLRDDNPAANIVEVSLEAAPGRWTLSPGRTVDALMYNGRVPGPLLEARVGDTVVVHFHNALTVPTTVHWHGLRVPASMDGGPHSQDPVPPGGRFTYRFVVNDAGTFWYHPHVNESRQMEAGLYGAIVVRGAHEPAADVETVMMLDDLTLDAQGNIAAPGDLVEQHGGREGPVAVVNGRSAPPMTIAPGQRQRWRIVNAGSARFYRLSLGGQTFWQVASDAGAWATPRALREVLLVPGDRVELLVDGPAAGASWGVENLAYDRGHGAGLRSPMALTTLVSEGPAMTPRSPPAGGPPTRWLPVEGAHVETVRFSERINRETEAVEFMVNGRQYPDVPPLHGQVGRTERWTLVNESEMEHPFHLHGFFFQVRSRNGVALADPAWEDTIQLRGHETVEIAFQPDPRPGHWMYHCHILEHVEHGMMGTFIVPETPSRDP
ncbi:MAG: multicopper oxidase family protein [Myxococcales bacterium]|nr:multicopper oxidase family protein [Myxococcales bacterium]